MRMERQKFFAAEVAGSAAEAPAPAAEAAGAAEPVKKEAPAAQVPEAPAAQAPAPVPPAPAPDEGTLRDLLATHARLEATTAELQAERDARTADRARLDAYVTHVARQVAAAIDVAPEFVKSRVKLNESNPLETAAELERLLGIYNAAKAELQNTQTQAGGASAPPPANGAPQVRIKSVWEPVGPIPKRR